MNHWPPSHFSIEKWHNSHFRGGLVSADGFLHCQVAGVMALLPLHMHPIQTAPGNSTAFAPTLHPVCWQENSTAVGATHARNSEETPVLPPALWASTTQVVLWVFTADSVSFLCPNCSSCSSSDSVTLQRQTHVYPLCSSLMKNNQNRQYNNTAHRSP